MEPNAHGLISNSIGDGQLALPDIRRITDLSKHLNELKHYNGNFNEVIENLADQTKQCEDIKELLKKQVQLKMDTLHQVKEDIEDIRRQLEIPNVPFIEDRKYLVKFLDETEMNEYELRDALARYSVKMSALYGEILAIDSDIDHLIYLTNIARLNEEFARNFDMRESDKELKNETL